jgi:hypothetical protein
MRLGGAARPGGFSQLDDAGEVRVDRRVALSRHRLAKRLQVTELRFRELGFGLHYGDTNVL